MFLSTQQLNSSKRWCEFGIEIIFKQGYLEFDLMDLCIVSIDEWMIDDLQPFPSSPEDTRGIHKQPDMTRPTGFGCSLT